MHQSALIKSKRLRRGFKEGYERGEGREGGMFMVYFHLIS